MKFGWAIFKLNLVTGSWVISCEIPLSWISLNLTDDKSTLVQVMAWCHQATSHYLNQCWPRSMSSYGITRPQWVNVMREERLRPRKRDGSGKILFDVFHGFCIYVAGFHWRGRLGFQRQCESNFSTLKSIVKVARPSPTPWDTDVDSPPRKCSKGEQGRSWEMDRQACCSRDHSNSCLRDKHHRDQDDGSWSTEDTGRAGSPSLSRRAEAFYWGRVPLGLVYSKCWFIWASSSRSRSTANRTALMVLPPHRRKSLKAWCPVLLDLFFTGIMLLWTRYWVLGPLRTTLKMIRLSAQMGPLPCGRGLLRATSPVLLGYLLWERLLQYHGQTVVWRVLRELGFHSCTFRPDRRLLGYGWQH